MILEVVCVRLHKMKSESKSVDVRIGMTVVSEWGDTECDVNGLHSMTERWTTLKKDCAKRKRMANNPNQFA